MPAQHIDCIAPYSVFLVYFFSYLMFVVIYGHRIGAYC